MEVNMADAIRAEKLAAARKKLKQYQGKTVKPSGSSVKKKSETPSPITVLEEIETAHHTDSSIINQPVQVSEYKLENNYTSIPTVGSNNHTVEDYTNYSEPVFDIPKSSTESLRQLTQKLNGLMNETNDILNGETDYYSKNDSELESRNQELAALVETLKQRCEESAIQLQELRNQNNTLQQKIQVERDEFDGRVYREYGALKEQLQVHIQTIGILVAEKTELQSSLAQNQQSFKQKAAEVEELQGRLKANRLRVTDLERDETTLKSNLQQVEKNSKQSTKDIDRLKLELYKSSKSLEEYQEQNSELKEKLAGIQNELQTVTEREQELRDKLAMSQLHVQQLSSGTSEEDSHQLELLHQAKIDAEKQVAELKDRLQTMSQDRDKVSTEYQYLVQQLSNQVQSLNKQVMELSSEKEDLVSTNEGLQEMVVKLEDHIGEEKSSSASQHNLEVELSELKALLERTQAENDTLSKHYKSQMNDNSSLSRMVQESEAKIESLESRISSLLSDQGDKTQVLNDLDSNKQAAARALAQNRELKSQLQELQDGFIKISNDKMELTEKFHAEKHVSSEQGERLAQQETELTELRDQLNKLLENQSQLNRQVFQQHHIEDRMRHYEAQGHLTELLQQELHQAQERIGALSAQNGELRTSLAQQAQRALDESRGEDGGNKEIARKDDLLASLSTSVRQLEMERNQLMRQLEEQQQKRLSIQEQMDVIKHTNNQGGGSGDAVSWEQYQQLRNSMRMLEEKFTKTMTDIAELSDQRQQLEHLVLQLQGENDTIGEYIALYQVQRGLLKQRAKEKDQYISQLAREREGLKLKLKELQNLVMQLMYERDKLNAGGTVQNSAFSFINSLQNGDESLTHVDQSDGHSERSTPPLSPITGITGPPSQPPPPIPQMTANKIIQLISEIGASSLVESPIPDDFHPCQVCSGRLQTV